jgi:AcrR family transcriptional regulator
VGDKQTRKSAVTSLSILRAAEKLFAARGVDNVSLREISEAAGQRNHAAAAYHFGDKRELLEAVLARHSKSMDAGFVPALDALRDAGQDDVHGIVRCVVHPLTRMLDDEDGGVDYVLICAELVNSHTHPMTALRAANGPGAMELTARLLARMPALDPILMPLRLTRFAAVLFTSIASYHRLTSAGLFIPRDRFEDDLVSTLVAVCLAPSRPT